MKTLFIVGLSLCFSTIFASTNSHEITLLLGRWNTLYFTGSAQLIYRSPDIFGIPLRIGAGVAGYGSLLIVSDGSYELWANAQYGLHSGKIFHVYAGAGGILFQSFPLKITSLQPVVFAGISARVTFFNPEVCMRFRFYSDGWMVTLLQDYRFYVSDYLFLTLHPNFILAGFYDFRYAEMRAEFFAGIGGNF